MNWGRECLMLQEFSPDCSPLKVSALQISGQDSATKRVPSNCWLGTSNLSHSQLCFCTSLSLYVPWVPRYLLIQTAQEQEDQACCLDMPSLIRFHLPVTSNFYLFKVAPMQRPSLAIWGLKALTSQDSGSQIGPQSRPQSRPSPANCKALLLRLSRKGRAK